MPLSTSVYYLVDNQYHILQQSPELAPGDGRGTVGQLCYKAMHGADTPCEQCPLKNPAGGGIYYNVKLQSWVEVNTTQMTLPGVGPCSLLLCHTLSGSNRALFYNLTGIAVFDQLYQICPGEDSLSVLYQMPGKYEKMSSGSYSGTIAKLAENYIHPDDRTAFLNLWQAATLKNRLLEINPGAILQGEFRRRRLDGAWHWTRHAFVRVNPLLMGEDAPFTALCFVYDVERENAQHQPLADRAQAKISATTGLKREQAFFHAAAARLQNSYDECCVLALDIDHFKLFNQWYGPETGDRFLRRFADILKEAQQKYGGVAGYFGNDDFALLMPNDRKLIDELQKKLDECVREYRGDIGFLPSIGAYAVTERGLSVRTMYDRATMALHSIKGNVTHRIGWYDDAMYHEMEEEHLLLQGVQHGLDAQEFVFYLQPQCNMLTGKIVGAEALVRWIKPTGIVPPGEFIPVLERSGFIPRLDSYLWEAVAAQLRRWLDAGVQPVPVSVNVSRMDILALDVPSCFQTLLEKYRLPAQLLKVEITETNYSTDSDTVGAVVDALRKQDISVLMDDFGSGYSSLNMLREVRVDVIKLDMKFLQLDSGSRREQERNTGILESIVGMAHMLELGVIAEGIETADNRKLLLDLDCQYGQGYYMYRPMPCADFEALLRQPENTDYRGIRSRQVRRLDLRDLLNANHYGGVMLENLLGGVALYRLHGDCLSLEQTNDQYYRITGSDVGDGDILHQDALRLVYSADRAALLQAFRHARENVASGGEVEVRRLCADGTTRWLSVRTYFWQMQGGDEIYYGICRNVTAEHEHRRALQLSRQAEKLLPTEETVAQLKKLDSANTAIAAQMLRETLSGGCMVLRCAENGPIHSFGDNLAMVLGYENGAEVIKMADGMVNNIICADDLKRNYKEIGRDLTPGRNIQSIFRMKYRDGGLCWMMCRGRFSALPDGSPVMICALEDISDAMQITQQFEESSAQLLSMNREMDFMLNDIPVGYYRTDCTPDLYFSYISSRFLKIVGYKRSEIITKFNNSFLAMVYPDDRDYVRQRVAENADDAATICYRVRGKNGVLWVNDQYSVLSYNGQRSMQGVLMDRTEETEQQRWGALIRENTTDDILNVSLEDGKLRYTVFAQGLNARLTGTPLADNLGAVLTDPVSANRVSERQRKRIFRDFCAAAAECRGYHTTVDLNEDGKRCRARIDCNFISRVRGNTSYLCIISAMAKKKPE